MRKLKRNVVGRNVQQISTTATPSLMVFPLHCIRKDNNDSLPNVA